MNELEEFEFRDRMEREAASRAVPTAVAATPASFADKMVGGWGGRTLLGMASPIIAGAQLLGGEGTRAKLAELEAMKQRGMQAEGKEGFDWYGLLGSLAPATGIAKGVTAALPAATGTLGKIGLGAAQGAAVSAATPSSGVTTDEYVPNKARQVGSGAVVGGAIPLVTETARHVGNVVNRMGEPLTESGRADLLSRYQHKLIGESPTAKQKVVDALMHAKELVPGSKPTAGEALAMIPEGTGLASHQRAVSKMEGISPQFTTRAAEQAAARAAAPAAREAATGPMREAALQQANVGGVKTDSIINQIGKMETEPGTRASDVVRKTLSAVKEKLASLTNEQGVIDAKDLYTVRKEVGNTIQGFAKETANWDKKLTGGLERDIQKGMDAAIETAGGTGWKDYLKEFATRSKAMADDLERQVAYRKLAQQTNFSGAKAIHEGIQFPNLLSRPAMIANFLTKHFANEPAHDAIAKLAASQYLNPQALAGSLTRGSVPSRYQAIIEALTQQGPAVAASGLARQQ